MRLFAVCGALPLLVACASHPDRFYVLESRPVGAVEQRTAFAQQVMLTVSLPPLIDRAELVIESGDRVTLLEHERWGSSLIEQVASTLSRDIEKRRPDVLASTRREPLGPPLTKIAVDVTGVTAQLGGRVTIDVQWRMAPPGAAPSAGRQSFTSSAGSDGYAAVAAALSDCLGLLADRLVRDLPAG